MKKSILIVSFLFILSIIFPYIIVYFQTPEGYENTGFITISYLVDAPTYLSKMVNNEGFTFMNMYNHLEQDGWKVFSLYSLMGMASKVTQLSPIVTLHLFRVLLSIVFMIVIYQLLKQLKVRESILPFVYAVVLFGNTGESIFYVLATFVVDMKIGVPKFIVEATPFGSALFFPHYTLALVLQCLAWVLALKYTKSYQPKYMLFTGLVFLFYSTVHPYSAVLTGVSIGMYLLYAMWSSNSLTLKNLYPILYMGLLPLPYLLTMYIQFKTNVVLLQWMSEAVLPIFMTFMVVIFGFWFLFVGLFTVSKENWKGVNILLLIWIWLPIIATFLPFSASYRFLEGVGIPILILFGIWIANRIKSKPILSIMSLFLLFSTTVLLVFEPLWATSETNGHWYRSVEVSKTYDWLKENKKEGMIVLSDLKTSNSLPAESQVLVYIGHNHETPQAEIREKLWKEFIKNPEKQWNSGWIQRNGITHIVFNKETVKVKEEKLSKLPLKKVYENKKMIIFEIME